MAMPASSRAHDSSPASAIVVPLAPLAERREVVEPDQQRRGLVHRVEVERSGPGEDVAPGERVERARPCRPPGRRSAATRGEPCVEAVGASTTRRTRTSGGSTPLSRRAELAGRRLSPCAGRRRCARPGRARGRRSRCDRRRRRRRRAPAARWRARPSAHPARCAGRAAPPTRGTRPVVGEVDPQAHAHSRGLRPGLGSTVGVDDRPRSCSVPRTTPTCWPTSSAATPATTTSTPRAPPRRAWRSRALPAGRRSRSSPPSSDLSDRPALEAFHHWGRWCRPPSARRGALVPVPSDADELRHGLVKGKFDAYLLLPRGCATRSSTPRHRAAQRLGRNRRRRRGERAHRVPGARRR